MKHTCLLVLLLLCIIGTNAQKIKDTLYFLNGSKVIGEIKRIKLGVIIFDPDDANDITVQLKVKTLAALMKVFQDRDNKWHTVYFSAKHPANLPGLCHHCHDHGSHFIRQNKSPCYMLIAALSVNGFLSGKAAAGFDFVRTSGLGRINFDNHQRQRRTQNSRSPLRASIRLILPLADREDMSLKANYGYFNTTWFSTHHLHQQPGAWPQTPVLQEGLGAGNKFITSKHV